MSAVVIAGNTSGTITLQAPAVSGSTVLNLPTVSGGTMVTSDSSNNVATGGINSSAWLSTRKAFEIGVQGSGFATNTGNGNFQNFSNIYTDSSGTNKYAGTGFGVVTTLAATAGTFSVFSTSTSGTAGATATLNNVFQTDSNGFTYFNSGYGSAAVAYGCRAWVNFNGTGTVAIRASGNVSSITDNGTGLYTVNLTTAMPDINYCATANASVDAAGRAVKVTVFSTNTATSAPTTSAFAINTTSDSNVSYDAAYVTVEIHR